MAGSFWGKTRASGACLLWEGEVDGFGYGRCERHGERGAHRVAWLLRRGAPAGGKLMNECGSKICVNPDHWRDSSVRPVSARQQRRAEILRLYEAGMGIGAIAQDVGCSRTTVWRRVREAGYGV